MNVGPFIVNMRQVAKEANQILEDMHLLLGEKWAYDPHQVISKRRVENGYSAFTHESKPEIEKLANKGFAGTGNTSIETLIISKKVNKRGK